MMQATPARCLIRPMALRIGIVVNETANLEGILENSAYTVKLLEDVVEFSYHHKYLFSIDALARLSSA